MFSQYTHMVDVALFGLLWVADDGAPKGGKAVFCAAIGGVLPINCAAIGDVAVVDKTAPSSSAIVKVFGSDCLTEGIIVGYCSAYLMKNSSRRCVRKTEFVYGPWIHAIH